MAAPFRPHLLVVDDEACIREALTAALGAIYVVHSAASGAEACALLDAHPIAAIILDAVLDAEHGLDLIPHFRALSSAPILILTGHSTKDLAIRAVRAQVVDYLEKPVDLAALRSAIRQLVPPPDRVVDLVTRARQALDAYPPKPFDPGTFAHQLGVGEGHLRRAFREAYKITPRRYLTDRRLERAATLLRTTRRGVEQIAHEVGFPTSVWFTKVFSRAYRMSPVAYRTTAPSLPPSAPVPRPPQRP